MGLLARPGLDGRGRGRQRAGAVDAHRSDQTHDFTQPATPCRGGHWSRRSCGGITEGATRSWSDAPPITRPPRAVRRRLPARSFPWSGCVGVGRGLDPVARPASFGQGTAHGHQRDPRCTRRGDHHRDQARQHRRHTHCPPGSADLLLSSIRNGWPKGLPAGLRWSPVRGCEDPLTAMIRATGLASATGLSTGWCRVRRLLGGQDPYRPPGAAPRSGTRQPDSARAIRLDSLTLIRGRCGRDLVEQPGGCTRLGRLVGVDDPLRPSHPRLDLDGRLPRPVLSRGPASARRRVPGDRVNTSIPSTSSPTTAPSTCSPPEPAQVLPGRSSQRSSRISSRPRATLPPRHPVRGSTRRF